MFDMAQLAMATLGTLAAGITLAMGGKKASKEQGPPINASSSQEEAFIKYVNQNRVEHTEKRH